MAEVVRLLDVRPADEEERHCLIVDDEAPLRRVLVRLLQGDGFTCEEAENGRRAIELLARRPATLILTDLHMPELDGIGLLRHVRAQYPDTAVMLVTAVADVRTAVACLGEGALDYVTKPFHVDEVRAKVRQAMDRRRLILENRDYQERLEEKVAIQARRLEELFLASIQSLADTLEVRDKYTHGHSIRVSRYSALIARELGLDDDSIRQVELGGRVHDIGKIGVREGVLNKVGPLSDEEYQHIMTHPAVGWRILSPLLWEQPRALAIVRHHHERWDGRGLPDGLAGEEIPYEARIASVADTFDAMTSQRPYRPGVSIPETVNELRRCRGTQFDARVVDAFLALMDRGEIQRDAPLPEGQD
jgi:response regulator RpfG family c-di-GMP phosphodiesterase